MKIKTVKKIIFTWLVILILVLAGCGEKTTEIEKEIVHLSFRDALSFEEIKQLNGMMVSIVGFMSTTSPLDGSYFYLQNMPYQSCPFCIPNTNQLLNTLAVYAPKGQSFSFMDVPVKVTGKIEVGEMTDAMGYRYGYRIVDAKVERAELSGLGREIRIYTELVDRGFVSLFTTAIEDIYITINFDLFDIEKEEVSKIDLQVIEAIKETFKGLNPEDYTDIINVVDRLEMLAKEANFLIENGFLDDLRFLNGECQDIYNNFYKWLIKPEI